MDRDGAAASRFSPVKWPWPWRQRQARLRRYEPLKLLQELNVTPGTGLIYALSGLVVGFVVGLTGVGGGSLMTPLLVLLFGVHPATAVGTDLLYAGVTKSVGTAVHGRSGSINWRIVG